MGENHFGVTFNNHFYLFSMSVKKSKPGIVEQSYQHYLKTVGLTTQNMHPVQQIETRRAFYAGVTEMVVEISEKIAKKKASQKEVVDEINTYWDEQAQFENKRQDALKTPPNCSFNDCKKEAKFIPVLIMNDPQTKTQLAQAILPLSMCGDHSAVNWEDAVGDTNFESISGEVEQQTGVRPIKESSYIEIVPIAQHAPAPLKVVKDEKAS